jgi:thiol-disulfide isomerase/thioredoxin
MIDLSSGALTSMRWSRFPTLPGVLAGLAALLIVAATAQSRGGAQDPQPAQLTGVQNPAPEETLQTINDDYSRQLLELDRGRVARISRLAARQDPVAAASTYEQLFRLAIAANLFLEAEEAAGAVVTKDSPSPTTVALAHLAKIIAESDRGAYEQSLQSLRLAFEKAEKAAAAGAPRAALSTGELMGICDAYYQRLVQGDQLQIARKAFRLALDHTQSPALREFLSSRLKRLDLVGKPAPAIQGTDLDGKPFNLADARGKVVLVVFWASWCLPSAAEVEWFQQAVEAYRGRGFEVVGINLDLLQDGGQKLETVMPNIRRFLLDHNVRWPNLVNGSGDKDYARAYGVTDIPANVLIGRDGTVVLLDLVRKNMESVISREVGR